MDSTAVHVETACSEQCSLAIELALNVIASKWSAPIIIALHDTSGPVRSADLARRLDGISPKEFSKKLRQLESAGLITRTVFAVLPPRVEYTLTDLGRSTYPVLEKLAEWGAQYTPSGATVDG